MNTNYSLPIVNLVAQRIDKLRIEQSLSLRELAKKSGISHSTLSNIIQATKIPNIYTLANICNALSISLSDFFNFDDTIITLRGKETIFQNRKCKAITVGDKIYGLFAD